MDPLSAIGAAASLVNLIDAGVGILDEIKAIVQRYRHAPEELLGIRSELDVLNTHLNFLRNLQLETCKDQLGLQQKEAGTLGRFLSNTTCLLETIKVDLEKLLENQNPMGKSSRLKWAIRDAAKAKKWQTKLQQQSTELARIATPYGL
jgi:hypothetical protein